VILPISFVSHAIALSPLSLDVALPVSGKIDRLTTLHCQCGNAVHLIAIRYAAVSPMDFQLPWDARRDGMAN
jgi:hypothetical protein